MASKNFYKILLQNDVYKSKKALQEDYDEQVGIAGKEANRGAIWGTIGGLIGQYGVPLLLAGLSLTPGGILVASAAGAGLMSYIGNKVGRGAGEQADTSAIEKQKFAHGVYDTATGNVQNIIDDIDESAQVSALKTGAAVGAQGITMGADKYAMHVKNPLGTYFKGMRNPEQTKAAFVKATKGLKPGTKAYTDAIKGVMPDYPVMDMQIPELKQMPKEYTQSLLDLAPDAGTYLQENMKNMPSFKSGTTMDEIFSTVPSEPLKKTLPPLSSSVSQSPWESMPSESTRVNTLLDFMQENNYQNDLLPEEQWPEYR